MDETPFNYVFLRGRVLAEKGKEEVDAQLPEDYRKSFTVIATIRSDGHKFPPVFLAQGKTMRATNQFSDMNSNENEYELFYSEGGNTDEKAMLHYLDLFSQWMNGEASALILDRYSSHMTDAVQMKAQRLNIRLVYIPTSATEKFQPLDARIFGIVKSMAASKFDDHVFETQDAYTKSQAADLFLQCWNRISSSTVIDAWDLCELFGVEDREDFESDDDENESSFDEGPSEETDEEEWDERLDEDDLVVIQETRIEERRNRSRLTPPKRNIK